MNEVTTTAFILKMIPYKEKDRLVYVYTKDFGKLTFLARGVNSLKSKNASALQELMLVEITFIPKKGICSLIRAQSINFYRKIKDNLNLQVYALYVNEYIYKLTEENIPDIYLYDLMIQSYEALENGDEPRLVYSLFNSLMLKYTGHKIEVNCCALCHATSPIINISIREGGFICRSCSQEQQLYHKEVLQLFRHIVLADLTKIKKIQYKKEDLFIVSRIIEQFVDEYSGIYFQTIKFM